MKYAEIEKALEQKKQLYIRQEGKCATCGGPLVPPWDCAHIIPKGKVNLKKYGPEIIHHIDNMAGTCRKADCNDAVMINPATQPVKAAEHVEMIKEKFRGKCEY